MASIYRFGLKWRAQVRLAGRPSASKLFATRNDAVRWAREQEGTVYTDIGKGGRAHTLKHLMKRYRETVTGIKKGKAESLKLLELDLGHLRLAELTSEVVIDFATRRRGGDVARQPRTSKRGRAPLDLVAPATVKKDVMFLAAVLKHGAAILNSADARKAHEACQRAIVTLGHARTIANSRKRSRRPTEAELTAIEEYADAGRTRVPLSDIILFAVATCMRLGEIVALQWEDLDDEHRVIVVRGRKDPTRQDGHDDLVPLLAGPFTYRGKTVDPLSIIKRSRTAKYESGRIFPYAENSISQAFRNACKNCGIKNLKFHDLRHDGISRMFEAGYDIPEVALVSGHRDWKNLQIYVQLRPTSLHRS